MSNDLSQEIAPICKKVKGADFGMDTPLSPTNSETGESLFELYLAVQEFIRYVERDVIGCNGNWKSAGNRFKKSHLRNYCGYEKKNYIRIHSIRETNCRDVFQEMTFFFFLNFSYRQAYNMCFPLWWQRVTSETLLLFDNEP